jgi:PspA-Associated protein
MIIRIMNENQYVVPSLYFDDINKLDNEIVSQIAKGDEKGFKKTYAKLIEIVRKNGVPMDVKQLKESDLIIPPADITFEEAKRIFVGEGLIPG